MLQYTAAGLQQRAFGKALGATVLKVSENQCHSLDWTNWTIILKVRVDLRRPETGAPRLFTRAAASRG